MFLFVVLPKIHRLIVEKPDKLIEGNSKFNIVCYIIANATIEVEFFFQKPQSYLIQPLKKVSTVRKIPKNGKYEWIATLERHAERNSSGKYFCRTSNDFENEVNVTVNMICMLIS